MSLIMMAKAFKVKVGNPTRKLVLIKLADHANDDGDCFPSYQHIADHCEISRRTAVSHVDALCKAGYLTKHYRQGPKGNTSNMYRVNLGGEISAPPSENSAPPPGENFAPRISHSSESSNEPHNKIDSFDLDGAFDRFWSAGMVKQGKAKAHAKFKSMCKEMKLSPHDLAEKLCDDIQRRLAAGQFGFDKLHPATYLNGKRWEDEITQNTSAQGGGYANSQGLDQQRAQRDRIAARLADPNDSGWIDGLFDEEGAAAGAGEPGVYPTGGDIPQDVANGIQHGSDAYPGEAGGGAIDGELVGTAYESGSRQGGREDQGPGRRMAPERGEPGQEPSSPAGGFWDA